MSCVEMRVGDKLITEPMSTLTSRIVSDVLEQLYAAARQADRPLRERYADLSPAERKAIFEAQQVDYRATYERMHAAYIPIDREFGTLLYILACARRARIIVEFGTSFGLSTIQLAAALRDGGGGRLVSTEFVLSKAEAARRNLEAAGLSDLVEIRLGDALETLKDGVGAPIDLVLLDGAKNLYVPLLKLLEPTLAPGALVATDNTTAESPYVAYVRDPANGYVSLGLPYESGNELSLWLGKL
jgi:predicted O-methyltransferase YrrM